MGIDPRRVAYLAGASGRLGPIAEAHITQRGEAIAPLVQRYQLLNHPASPACAAESVGLLGPGLRPVLDLSFVGKVTVDRGNETE